MKSKCASLLAGLVLLGGVTRAEATPITYAVSLFSQFDDVGVGGSITTDGKLGSLGPSDILDFQLFAADLVGANFFFLNSNGAISSSVGNLVNITATPNALTLGLAGPDPIIIPPGDLLVGEGGLHSIDFTVSNTSPIGAPAVQFTICTMPFNGTTNLCSLGFDTSNGLTFADGKVIETTTAVPGPIAGAGLPGLIAACGGFLAWWRGRRRARLAESKSVG
jgi:hypothetical protein